MHDYIGEKYNSTKNSNLSNYRTEILFDHFFTPLKFIKRTKTLFYFPKNDKSFVS